MRMLIPDTAPEKAAMRGVGAAAILAGLLLLALRALWGWIEKLRRRGLR